MRPPSVDALARSLEGYDLPHQLKVEAARRSISMQDSDNVGHYARQIYEDLLRPVINGTGIILHTNLGRAPLSTPAKLPSSFSYTNIEFDLSTGKRSSRDRRAGSLISKYIESEAAIAVNNGAAALFLVLSALATDRAVIVSRGELVEIGGGFRIPEVLRASGARLVEVGTTNKTRLSDYRNAAEPGEAAAIIKVHTSNYKMIGFTESVSVSELKSLGLPVIYDIGSGLLDETAPWMGWPTPAWLAGEPGAKQAIKSGADLVTFSGDKLMGGPQAGIIAGKKELVDACARHPLYRAMRLGGLVLGQLQATIEMYLDNRGGELPLWQMAKADLTSLKKRALALGVGEVVPLKSAIGGGSLPGLEIDSYGISLKGDRTAELRKLKIAVIARMSGPCTVIDLRTIDPQDDDYLRESMESLE